jgi:hypothetical protein
VLHHATQKCSISLWTEFRKADTSDVTSAIGPFSHSHVITVELAHVRSTSDLVREVSRAISASSEHKDVPLDLVWRAMNRSGVRTAFRASQVSFQHITFRASDHRATTFVTRVCPVLETDRRMALQFRSYDDSGELAIVATYDRSRLHREAVDTLLADIVDVLCDLFTTTDGATQHAACETAAGVALDRRRPVVDSVLAGHFDTCQLCAFRSERQSGTRPAVCQSYQFLERGE